MEAILSGAVRPGTARSFSRALGRVATAVAAFAATLALIRHGGVFAVQAWSGSLEPIAIVLAAASTLPLAMWWREPMGVFVATGVAAIALAAFGYPADVLAGPAIALYLLVSAGTSRRTAAVAGVLFAGYLMAAGLAGKGFPGSELLHNGLAWGVAWFAGERTRLRREQLAELHARAERAEREAGMQRQLAVAQERARIARDLHDSAGHAINVIAVRAGAARLRQDPARSHAALTDIENLARQTAAQIDEIIGGLRARDEPTLAPPGVASLQTLVAQHKAAGLEVTWKVQGAAHGAGSPADQAIYRCVQEALTNAARHGAGGADLLLCIGDGCADLTVSNRVGGGSSRSGGGHGLIGMRERVTLLGGTVQTDCRDGTFQLQVRIPMAGSQ
jgi:signal transduction histidine kinase